MFTPSDDLEVNVIAFDPGGTTGYAVLGIHSDDLMRGTKLPQHLTTVEYGEIDCGTRHGQTGVGVHRGHDGMNIIGEVHGIMRMVALFDTWDQSPVVVEDFVLDVHKANRGRDLLTPVRLISGFASALTMKYGDKVINKLFVQNRSLAKTTCTDDRLKNWNLYDRNSGPHARDALRHALYFLRTCSGSDSSAYRQRHLAWPWLFPDETSYPMAPKKKGYARGKRAPGERVTGLG